MKNIIVFYIRLRKKTKSPDWEDISRQRRIQWVNKGIIG